MNTPEYNDLREQSWRRPLTPAEQQGLMPSVVFPTAVELRDGHRLDVYYGAADSVIGVAKTTVPEQLPRMP